MASLGFYIAQPQQVFLFYGLPFTSTSVMIALEAAGSIGLPLNCELELLFRFQGSGRRFRLFNW